MDWELLAQQVLNGLTIGSMYALIALGYTMVYGILQLINFAHGEVFMIGSFLGLGTLMSLEKWVPGLGVVPSLAAALIVAMSGAALLGVAIERIAYRPLRHSPRLSLLITALGLSIILQNGIMLLVGTEDRTYPERFTEALQEGFDLGTVHVAWQQVLTLGVALAFMSALTWMVQRTRLGKAMRATSQDPVTAGLMGIESNRIVALTFAMGSALAAVGGLLFGLNYSINFFIGTQAGLKAFIAAVLGGIGSLPGAVVGGLLLGVIEALGAGYVSGTWKDVFAFVILAVVLVFRPAGLLGRPVVEKV
ncbi:MAG: branched-chain amino acid ABC transporter permease [Candidatus Sericytochromatia bacterium]|nr:branched-chain amino acid ABC transporter permease [Candidatus Sericytochromatia bacterium]